MHPALPRVRRSEIGKPQRSMRVPKAAELLASQIRRQIILGQLEEGEVLLPEAKLIKQSGVSRPTLREAFRILESEAFIAVNRGSRGGARILAPNVDVAARYAGIYLQHANTTFEDVPMARAFLEPPAARTLAERSDPRMIQELRDHIAIEEQNVDDVRAFAQLSAQFHDLVMELAGNKTLALLVAMLSRVVEKYSTRVLEPVLDVNETERTLQSHRRLVDLIEAGDGEEALSHWREHGEAMAQAQLKALGGDDFLDVVD